MERTPSTPYSRAGGLAALGGSMLVAGSMFLPWADAGGGTVNFWGLADVEAVSADAATYGLSLALIPLLVLWCALFFAWRTHEVRMAWAFGGFTGAMLLYGGDLRLSEDLPAAGQGAGEVVAAVGLLLLAAGCVLALAANVPEPAGSRADWKGSL
ncbi:hypothetical protein [Glycomyces terrestris]|uniref:Uncharacterized protein n=1 Tax=Glycomyces terrestris TaxID=2493553 RepID=A0A426UWQ2_9ACTN|nr:hypothetical protein [Glycomyces terrestris]RRR98639.1 hypothetical protein EIW28_17405 [Glycomyces terrestris]